MAAVKLTATEPVVAGITPAIVVSVVLGGLQVFDVWTPSDDQNAWIYAALLPLLMALGSWFVGRRNAWAPASVERRVAAERAQATQVAQADRAQTDDRDAYELARAIVALTSPPPGPPMHLPGPMPPRSMAAGLVAPPPGPPPRRP